MDNMLKKLKFIATSALSALLVVATAVPAQAALKNQAEQKQNEYNIITYYNIAFDANPSSVGMTDDKVTGETASILKIKNHEKKTLTENGFGIWGYKFVEWNTKPDGSGDVYTNKQEVVDLDVKYNIPHDGTIVLYAQWEADMYTVHYDPNTGTGHMDDQHILWIDTTTRMSENQFTKPRFRFIGWSLNPFDDKPMYPQLSVHYTNKKDGVERYGANPGDTITLYALWEPIPQPGDQEGYYRVSGVPGKGGDSYFKHTASKENVVQHTIDTSTSGTKGNTTYQAVYYADEDVAGKWSINESVPVDAQNSQKTYNKTFGSQPR